MKKTVIKRASALVMCALLTAGTCVYANAKSEEKHENSPYILSTVDTYNAGTQNKGGMDVSDIAEAAMPSVVSITTKTIEEVQDYYGQYSFFGFGSYGSQPREVDGAGSGFIIGQNDTELMCVTNYHVVKGAEQVTVTFNDGTTYEAATRGYDSAKDIAVVSIPLEDIDESTLNAIKIATLGDSDKLRIGEQVVAIGNALGYGQSVTTGIVSALNRVMDDNMISNSDNVEDKNLTKLIQTDAAINPGNSGGALLNMDGEVIGINSAKTADTNVEGMCYAIAISDVTDLIENLATKEYKGASANSGNAALGIQGLTVDDKTSEAYGIPKGVMINSVNEGSGAEEAGLVKGMVITGIDGTSVSSIEELKDKLSSYAPDDVVTLTVESMTDGGYTESEIEVTLMESTAVQEEANTPVFNYGTKDY
ncbi:MAG: trypsin-like peptidase domain-containing protein [Clostridia bacterium]|nr:trypsin-like peptidase domain-containing protein [Clostridia bacterium]